ncbi:MAG: peptidase M16 [Cyanobacteria bacterium QH_10_48_56]|nr:MAG: peptidase M16 [Cyanobacteria bacterium QH_10_48_56]
MAKLLQFFLLPVAIAQQLFIHNLSRSHWHWGLNEGKRLKARGKSSLLLIRAFRLSPFAFWLIVLVSVVTLAWTLVPNTAQARNAPTETQSIKPYLDRVTERVSEYELDNGMNFIILEKQDRESNAPTISFVTYADVGSANESAGKTGSAHYLEHLAFKGTKRIGTTDYSQEKPLLERLDELFVQMQAAKAANRQGELAPLEEKFAQLQEEASEYVVPNEYGQIVREAGGVDLNAATSADYTVYFYSFPANKLELWESLESERFLEPVFREFYKEKQVILEERRLRTENSAIGKMMEAFLETAYQEHPYGRPVIGYTEDLLEMRREEIREFFETYYVPGNLTMAVVGDVDPEQVKQQAEAYFGRYEEDSAPPKVTEVEPRQQKTREVTVEFPAQPLYLEGYHRPSINHPDHVVYEIISRVLSGGRTSRLYQSLVQEKQVALTAEGISSFPGNKFPNLVLFYALTAPNGTIEEVATALGGEIERIKAEPVSIQELERVKRQARADLLRTLDSNQGVAQLLAEYDAKTGSWQNVFKELEAITSVTADDVQRVAQATFKSDNRTVGRLTPGSEGDAETRGRGDAGKK